MKNILNFKSSFPVFAMSFLLGIVGGCLAIMLHSYFGSIPSRDQTPASDIMATANTYIVFTTFIFTGVTVVLAIAGYIFSQNISISTETNQELLFNALKEKVLKDEKMGISLLQTLLENPDVNRQFRDKITEKTDAHLQEKLKMSQATYNQAAEIRDSLSAKG
jgi:hypothetical protein